MPWNFYVKTATNKWLLISESRGDLKWCTPCRGKLDQHDMYTSHASPCTLDIRFPQEVPVRGNLSRVIDRVGWILLPPRKSAPDSTSQPRWEARGTRLSFSPNRVIEAVGLSQASINDSLLGLPGLYHRHAIGTFNTCSRGSTHRSLTDIGGGLQPWRCRLSIHHYPTFPTDGPPHSTQGPRLIFRLSKI
jgi:hypothetical protein